MSHRQYFEQPRSERGCYILNWLPDDSMRAMALAMPIYGDECQHLIRINQGYTIPINMGVASVFCTRGRCPQIPLPEHVQLRADQRRRLRADVENRFGRRLTSPRQAATTPPPQYTLTPPGSFQSVFNDPTPRYHFGRPPTPLFPPSTQPRLPASPFPPSTQPRLSIRPFPLTRSMSIGLGTTSSTVAEMGSSSPREPASDSSDASPSSNRYQTSNMRTGEETHMGAPTAPPQGATASAGGASGTDTGMQTQILSDYRVALHLQAVFAGESFELVCDRLKIPVNTMYENIDTDNQFLDISTPTFELVRRVFSSVRARPADAPLAAPDNCRHRLEQQDTANAIAGPSTLRNQYEATTVIGRVDLKGKGRDTAIFRDDGEKLELVDADDVGSDDESIVVTPKKD